MLRLNSAPLYRYPKLVFNQTISYHFSKYIIRAGWKNSIKTVFFQLKIGIKTKLFFSQKALAFGRWLMLAWFRVSLWEAERPFYSFSAPRGKTGLLGRCAGCPGGQGGAPHCSLLLPLPATTTVAAQSVPGGSHCSTCCCCGCEDKAIECSWCLACCQN